MAPPVYDHTASHHQGRHEILSLAVRLRQPSLCHTMKGTALVKQWSRSSGHPSAPSVDHSLMAAPTYQLHSGGTSLVSSSRDFSDLYSWQEAHQMCCSKGGTPTRQVPIMSLVPHPDGISGCTHLNEANSHHDQHGLEERVPGREDVGRTSR